MWAPSLVSAGQCARPGIGTTMPQGIQFCSSWGVAMASQPPQEQADLEASVLGSWFTATSCLLARPQPHSS